MNFSKNTLSQFFGLMQSIRRFAIWVRPHYSESTTSRPICEVKHCQAQLVLRWAITRESWVLYSFFRGRSMGSKGWFHQKPCQIRILGPFSPIFFANQAYSQCSTRISGLQSLTAVIWVTFLKFRIFTEKFPQCVFWVHFCPNLLQITGVSTVLACNLP